jgi:hypothetical protein
MFTLGPLFLLNSFSIINSLKIRNGFSTLKIANSQLCKDISTLFLSPFNRLRYLTGSDVHTFVVRSPVLCLKACSTFKKFFFFFFFVKYAIDPKLTGPYLT